MVLNWFSVVVLITQNETENPGKERKRILRLKFFRLFDLPADKDRINGSTTGDLSLSPLSINDDDL